MNCEICARPQGDDATICAACAHLLDAHLADITAYHGLAWDLALATARQTALTSRSGSRPATTPVPYDARASRAADELQAVLTRWARTVATETGDQPPGRTLTAAAAYLRRRVGWLRHHPDGALAHEQISDAVRQARRVCDRPADRLYAGRCDCGTDLYARLDAAYVVCRDPAHGEEGVAWPVEERRRWLLASAEDVLATTTEISRALTRYARPVTPAAIRGYAARGRLVMKGERVENGRRVPLYRLGDVMRLVIGGEKASA